MLELWQQAADGGIAEAFYHLGRVHELGVGVPYNVTQARAYYRQGYHQAPYVAEAAALLLAWYGTWAKAWLYRAVRLLHPVGSGLKAGTAAMQLSSLKALSGLDALGGWRTLCTLCACLTGVLWLRRLRRLRHAQRPC